MSSVENTSSRMIESLYSSPIPSTRKGALYNAHSYPTKINARAILPFVLAHTVPGDTVFDGFSGTGATGFALSMCNNPSPDVKEMVMEKVESPKWGQRKGILYDISELATYVSKTLLHPPAPQAFSAAARDFLQHLEEEWGWLYEAEHDLKGKGKVRYIIWSDIVICPYCEEISTYWDLAVDLSGPNISADVTCPFCMNEFDASSAEHVVKEYYDELLDRNITRRERTPILVYGKTAGSYWKRPINESDLKLINKVNNTKIPTAVPVVPMLVNGAERWGELYRAGYHKGITHLHHFYTRRNLIALGKAWEKIEHYDNKIQDGLRLLVSSYNSSHSTIMTRVVGKKRANDLVVTGAQPGALYVSSLPVEKNVFSGMRTKLRRIEKAFEKMYRKNNGKVKAYCKSSLDVDLPDASVDYIFTDPPFGDNIQYSEVNFINEAWLGSITQQKEEVIVSPYQNKTIDEYRKLLSRAFSEFYRILKPGHYMTVVFHSSKSEVWNSLLSAWENAGFEMIVSSILDKTQASFKQTTTAGSVKGDPVILLRKPLSDKAVNRLDISKGNSDEIKPWKVVSDYLSSDACSNKANRTKQRLYSYLVMYYLERGEMVPMNADYFFSGLDRRFEKKGEHYYLKAEKSDD